MIMCIIHFFFQQIFLSMNKTEMVLTYWGRICFPKMVAKVSPIPHTPLDLNIPPIGMGERGVVNVPSLGTCP